MSLCWHEFHVGSPCKGPLSAESGEPNKLTRSAGSGRNHTTDIHKTEMLICQSKRNLDLRILFGKRKGEEDIYKYLIALSKPLSGFMEFLCPLHNCVKYHHPPFKFKYKY